ncbi:MAG TPA: hypothetical protein VL652_01535 [Kutzneria sp.]|nr:hypothetical protein [Kutzneria sp.]
MTMVLAGQQHCRRAEHNCLVQRRQPGWREVHRPPRDQPQEFGVRHQTAPERHVPDPSFDGITERPRADDDLVEVVPGAGDVLRPGHQDVDVAATPVVVQERVGEPAEVQHEGARQPWLQAPQMLDLGQVGHRTGRRDRVEAQLGKLVAAARHPREHLRVRPGGDHVRNDHRLMHGQAGESRQSLRVVAVPDGARHVREVSEVVVEPPESEEAVEEHHRHTTAYAREHQLGLHHAQGAVERADQAQRGGEVRKVELLDSVEVIAVDLCVAQRDAVAVEARPHGAEVLDNGHELRRRTEPEGLRTRQHGTTAHLSPCTRSPAEPSTSPNSHQHEDSAILEQNSFSNVSSSLAQQRKGEDPASFGHTADKPILGGPNTLPEGGVARCPVW